MHRVAIRSDQEFHEIRFIKPAHASVRRATIVVADSVKKLARSLATSFDIDDAAFDDTYRRIKDDENVCLLVSNDDAGAINGYLLGFTHDAFFANGTICVDRGDVRHRSDAAKRDWSRT